MEHHSIPTSQGLNLEQQFKLHYLQQQVQDLTVEELQKYCIELLRQSMVKDNLMRQLFKSK